MVLRSHTVWLVPVALTLLGFGPGAARATAQTTYPFSAYYDTVVNIMPITEDLSEVVESGESTDAPYGLTQYNGLVYAQTDLDTGEVSFDSDPATFGLQDEPVGNIVFGSGTNKLFGTASATTLIDFENFTASGSGTVTITGGEGIFENATGTLLFSENDTFSPEEPTTLRGRALVSGSIEAVPEPGTGTGTLVGLGVIGAGFLLRRRRLAPSLVNTGNTQS